MPNETKRIAVRPNIGSALQRAVDAARADGVSVSDLIHHHAAVAEMSRARRTNQPAKRKEQA